MKVRPSVLLLTLSCLALPPARAGAQVCWWRTSLERCKLLIITETALSTPLANTHGDKLIPGMTPADSLPLRMAAFHPELAWELAFLFVLDRRTAVGPSVQRGWAFVEGESTKRLMVRVRRQQTRALSLEASAGVIQGHAGDSGDRAYLAPSKLGPTLELRANLAELISGGVRYDQLPWRDNDPNQRNRYPEGTARALSGFVSLGAKPSVPVNVILLAGFIALAIGLSGVD